MVNVIVKEISQETVSFAEVRFYEYSFHISCREQQRRWRQRGRVVSVRICFKKSLVQRLGCAYTKPTGLPPSCWDSQPIKFVLRFVSLALKSPGVQGLGSTKHQEPIRWSLHLLHKPCSLRRFRALIEERANENREMIAGSRRIHVIQAHHKRKWFYL